MKTNPWHSILLALLMVNAAGTALLTWQYSRSMRQLQRLHDQINFEMNVFRALITETVEYSKKNAAMVPVLQSLGFPVNVISKTPPSGINPSSNK